MPKQFLNVEGLTVLWNEIIKPRIRLISGSGAGSAVLLDSGSNETTNTAGGADQRGDVALGRYNTINGNSCFGTGAYNATNADHSTVTGLRNTITGNEAFIGGGSYNTVSEDKSCIIGGDHNTVSAQHAIIIGGSRNIATETGSVAISSLDGKSTGNRSLLINGIPSSESVKVTATANSPVAIVTPTVEYSTDIFIGSILVAEDTWDDSAPKIVTVTDNLNGSYTCTLNNILSSVDINNQDYHMKRQPTSSGSRSLAFGSSSATGSMSVAIGQDNINSGASSICVGTRNVVSGINVFSVGRNNIVSGNYSTAFGYGLKATSANQLIIGKRNEEANLPFIIGNGIEADGTRININTVDWNGNGWYKGKVSVGTTDAPTVPTANNDLTTKKYVDDIIAQVYEDIEGISIDDTLSIEGNAADAKATGDAIATKVSINQGTINAGKVLVIGADGNVAPGVISDDGSGIPASEDDIAHIEQEFDELADYIGWRPYRYSPTITKGYINNDGTINMESSNDLTSMIQVPESGRIKVTWGSITGTVDQVKIAVYENDGVTYKERQHIDVTEPNSSGTKSLTPGNYIRLFWPASTVNYLSNVAIYDPYVHDYDGDNIFDTVDDMLMKLGMNTIMRVNVTAEMASSAPISGMLANLSRNTISYVIKSSFSDAPANAPENFWILSVAPDNSINMQIIFEPVNNVTWTRSYISSSWTSWAYSLGETKSNVTYYAIGDRITWGLVYPATSGSMQYQADYIDRIPTRIAHAVGSDSFTNNGIIDAKFVRQDSEAIQTIGEIIEATDLSNVDLITIGGGLNDTDASLGNAVTSTANDGTICGAIRAILNHLTTTYPKIAIVVYGCTPNPGATDAVPAKIFSHKFAGGWSLDEYYSEVGKVCMEYGVPFIDWYSCPLIRRWGSISGGYNETSRSWAHPLTSDIYKQMGNYLAGQVASYYKG